MGKFVRLVLCVLEVLAVSASQGGHRPFGFLPASATWQTCSHFIALV
jgi:hypothetical protein